MSGSKSISQRNKRTNEKEESHERESEIWNEISTFTKVACISAYGIRTYDVKRVFHIDTDSQKKRHEVASHNVHHI